MHGELAFPAETCFTRFAVLMRKGCEPGRNYQLQVSTDLVSWTPLQHILMTNNIVPWIDAAAASFGVRFYRLQALP